MRPIRKTISAVASSDAAPLDHYISPFNATAAVLVSGSLTYTVEYTHDDVFAPDFDSATANWTPIAGLSGQTASADENIAFPVAAVRLRVSAYTSGSATLTLTQAGGPMS